MTDVTQILNAIQQGDALATHSLLPIVYEELRNLAAARLARENIGHTLQPTALVHEVYLRLVGPSANDPKWQNRGHFFAAAAEAMRRILVENARRKNREKHGGQWQRSDENLDLLADGGTDPLLVLAVDEALTRLAQRAPRRAELVKLKFFVGCTIAEAADILGISASTAEDDWILARAWLRREWLRSNHSE